MNVKNNCYFSEKYQMAKLKNFNLKGGDAKIDIFAFVFGINN